MMRNRYGVEYDFELVSENMYAMIGKLVEEPHWRVGGKEGQSEIDLRDLGFVDPSGGPFICPGFKIGDKVVIKIAEESGRFLFEVV
jgi:hypothetical protein